MAHAQLFKGFAGRKPRNAPPDRFQAGTSVNQGLPRRGELNRRGAAPLEPRAGGPSPCALTAGDQNTAIFENDGGMAGAGLDHGTHEAPGIGGGVIDFCAIGWPSPIVSPPATRTRPSLSSTALWPRRAVYIEFAGWKEPSMPKISALASTPFAPLPPVIRIRPFRSKTVRRPLASFCHGSCRGHVPLGTCGRKPFSNRAKLRTAAAVSART